LIAAGIGAGLATGYTHLDNLSVGVAQAATQPVAVAAAQAATQPVAAPATASNLPDFTALVDRAGASVVNISTFHAAGKGGQDLEDIDEDSPYYEFFKRFGGIPNGPGMRPQQPPRGVARVSS
jgi:serine protease Do